MSKRVLFVATLTRNHIMEFHIPYLKLFKESGWETAVAAKNDYDRPEDCHVPYCDRFFDLPFERSPFKPSNLKAIAALKKIVDQGGYDIIHCHTPVGALAARLAALKARRHGTRVIYTAHGFHFYKGAPKLNWLAYYPVEKLLARCTDVLITINREDYERAKRSLRAGRIEYIPGVGIDTAKFAPDAARRREMREALGIPQDAFVLLSIGDLNENKNHRSVLEILPQLGQDVWYVVCGRGPLMETHRALADRLSVGKRVKFMGYRDDVPDFYRMADAFVFPSFREGLSVSVMEAMAAGLPVLCSAIRGNTDMIEDGVNGFLFDPARPEDIARAIRQLRALPAPDGIRQANLEKARRYDLDEIRSQYARIYGL